MNAESCIVCIIGAVTNQFSNFCIRAACIIYLQTQIAALKDNACSVFQALL